jgi:hypothetical protein
MQEPMTSTDMCQLGASSVRDSATVSKHSRESRKEEIMNLVMTVCAAKAEDCSGLTHPRLHELQTQPGAQHTPQTGGALSCSVCGIVFAPSRAVVPLWPLKHACSDSKVSASDPRLQFTGKDTDGTRFETWLPMVA